MQKLILRQDNNLVEHRDYVISDTDMFSFLAVPDDLTNIDLVSKLILTIYEYGQDETIKLTKDFIKQEDNSFLVRVSTIESTLNFEQGKDYKYEIKLVYIDGNTVKLEDNSYLIFD